MPQRNESSSIRDKGEPSATLVDFIAELVHRFCHSGHPPVTMNNIDGFIEIHPSSTWRGAWPSEMCLSDRSGID